MAVIISLISLVAAIIIGVVQIKRMKNQQEIKIKIGKIEATKSQSCNQNVNKGISGNTIINGSISHNTLK